MVFPKREGKGFKETEIKGIKAVTDIVEHNFYTVTMTAANHYSP